MLLWCSQGYSSLKLAPGQKFPRGNFSELGIIPLEEENDVFRWLNRIALVFSSHSTDRVNILQTKKLGLEEAKRLLSHNEKVIQPDLKPKAFISQIPFHSKNSGMLETN